MRETQISLFNESAALPTDAPFRPHSATSREAAEKINPHLNRLQKIVIGELAKRGAQTPDELAERAQIDFMAIRPRFTELRKLGFIFADGTGTSRSGSRQQKFSLTFRGEKLAKEIASENSQ